jgi:hypothetical protein
MKDMTRIMTLCGVLLILGCKEKKTDYDLLRFDDFLERPIAKRSSEVRNKILLAKNLYLNKQDDPVPLFIYASIDKPKEKDNYDIVFLYYDEDKDLLGIGIQEKWFDENGNVVKEIEDTFPTFLSCEIMEPLAFCIQGVALRDSLKIDYKQMWEEYQKKDIPKTTTWQETLTPPVVVSLPEKNKEIYIWLYDSKGNTSEKLKLELRENIESRGTDPNNGKNQGQRGR